MKYIITQELIKSLNPGTDTYANYLKFYKGEDLSFDEFLDLKEISYNDKVWIARRVLNKNQLVHWAILCAQSVLHIFEEKYPNDKRPRECIDYLLTIKDFSNITGEQLEKIRKASRAAYSAAYGASYTLAAADAAYTAAAAAAYAAARACVPADAYAAAAREKQQELNLNFLKVVAEI